jgi:hypothetical protein
MSRKVFTADEVLTAEDVNSFLMDQTVMSFAGTAARGSAIPIPVEGMVTYLEDTNDLQVNTGSAYSSILGWQHISTTSVTTASSTSFNNVFNSTYDNYKVVVNATTTNNPQNITLRLRVGGVDNTSLEYRLGTMFIGAGTNQAFSGNNNTSTTEWILGTSQGATGMTAEIAVNRPFLSELTSVRALSVGAFLMVAGGQTTVTTSYTGFTLRVDSGTFSGTVSIYGIRK